MTDANGVLAAAFDTSRGALRVSLGESLPTTDWTSPTLASGWADIGSGYQATRYRKILGVTYIQGIGLNSSGSSLSTALFTLPAGYRPGGKLTFLSIGTIAIEIRPDGSVIPNSSIDNGAFVGLTCSFPADA